MPLHLHLPPEHIRTAEIENDRQRQSGQTLPFWDQPDAGPDGPASRQPRHAWIPNAKADVPTLNEAMAAHIRYALQLCNGKISGPGGAGELLGINPNTLRKRMDKLGIAYGRVKPSPTVNAGHR